MRPYSWAWLTVAVIIAAIEASAIYRGSFEDTLSGNLVAIMRSSPWLAWLIPTLVIGLAVHLMLEAFRVT